MKARCLRWTRWLRSRQLRLLLVALAVALPAQVAVGATAGISLSRSPAPPQSAKIGVDSETIAYSVAYDSNASRVVVDVTDLQGTSVAPLAVRDLGDQGPGVGSPVTGTVTWPVPTGLAAGRYFARVQFYSNGDLSTPEATATAAFDLAPQVGTLTLVKFEDLNGNGVRDPGEPGVPGWRFRIVSPTGFASEVSAGPDGTVTLPSVAAGDWQVTELAQPGWVAATPVSGTVSVPANGTATFTAGNYRPGVLSGIVFQDVNRNGGRDAGEPGQAGATVSLTGVDGLGRPVSAQTTTAADGSYAFPNLAPGTYTVSAAPVPGDAFTTPSSIQDLPIVSGGASPGNDFGIAPPLPTVREQAVPTPTKLTIAKTGPRRLTAGQDFLYRITLRNGGSFVARNVVVTDPVPVQITLLRIPSAARVVNGVVTWRLGNLPAHSRRVLLVRARLAPGAPAGTYRNTATARADNARPVRASTAGRLTRPSVRATRAGGVTG